MSKPISPTIASEIILAVADGDVAKAGELAAGVIRDPADMVTLVIQIAIQAAFFANESGRPAWRDEIRQAVRELEVDTYKPDAWHTGKEHDSDD